MQAKSLGLSLGSLVITAASLLSPFVKAPAAKAQFFPQIKLKYAQTKKHRILRIF